MVRTLHLRLLVAGSIPSHDSRHYLIISDLGDRLWDITTTEVNSALHPSGVAKSSTNFGWIKSGNVTAAERQVTNYT